MSKYNRRKELLLGIMVGLCFSLLLACAPVFAELVQTSNSLNLNSIQNPGEKPRFAGMVTKMQGDWIIVSGGKKTPIVAGGAIPYGARLMSISKGASIRGWLINHTSFKCPGEKCCGKPFEPLIAKSEKKPWWLIGLDLLTAPIGDWIKPAPRSLDGSFRDGVVLVQNGRVNLAECIIDTKRNKSPALEFVALETLPGSEAEEPLILSLKTDENSKYYVEIGDIKPGAYLLSKAESKAPHLVTGDSCWILIEDQSNFSSVKAEYEKALDSLREVEDNDNLLGVRRAYMIALSTMASSPSR